MGEQVPWHWHHPDGRIFVKHEEQPSKPERFPAQLPEGHYLVRGSFVSPAWNEWWNESFLTEDWSRVIRLQEAPDG